jgi:GntR family transcriptional regulator, phosphonate transport system regulatory protein
VKPGTELVRIDALRQADGVPICVGTSWFAAERFSGAAKVYAAKRSITKTLAHFGVQDYRRANTRLVAAIADASDAAWLNLERGGAVLVVDSVDVDLAGRPVVTSRARFAAERVEFTFDN